MRADIAADRTILIGIPEHAPAYHYPFNINSIIGINWRFTAAS